MLVPHDSGKVKRFSIPSYIIKAGVAFTVLIWIASLAMFYNFFSLKYRVTELAHAEKEAVEQKLQIDALSNKMKFMEVQLSRLQTLDKGLREMAKLDTRGFDAQASGGFGNPAGDNAIDTLSQKSEALAREVSRREKSLVELSGKLEKKRSQVSATPSIWPTRGHISSAFGWRKDPVTRMSEHHDGMDIAAAFGTPVFAVAEGKVIFSGPDQGYGRVVVIEHGYGLATRYAHMSKLDVKEGAILKKGQRIGAVGSSGKSTGAHLHYEVWMNGKTIDPSRYLVG